ncbi:MAG: hypothetical protein KDA51_08790, partial [Planctomycetales bacterium]|nr:hypothetical protein [Planctomycetales bacterium]
MKNSLPFTFRLALLLASLFVLHAAELADAREVPLGFVRRHCSDCHAGDDAEGGFRVDRLGDDLGDAANHKGWSRVLARVQSGEMPPPRETERPAEAEIIAALGALKTAFHES